MKYNIFPASPTTANANTATHAAWAFPLLEENELESIMKEIETSSTARGNAGNGGGGGGGDGGGSENEALMSSMFHGTLNCDSVRGAHESPSEEPYWTALLGLLEGDPEKFIQSESSFEKTNPIEEEQEWNNNLASFTTYPPFDQVLQHYHQHHHRSQHSQHCHGTYKTNPSHHPPAKYLPFDSRQESDRVPVQPWPEAEVFERGEKSECSSPSKKTKVARRNGNAKEKVQNKPACQILRWTAALAEEGLKTDGRKKFHHLSTDDLWSIWKQEQAHLNMSTNTASPMSGYKSKEISNFSQESTSNETLSPMSQETFGSNMQTTLKNVQSQLASSVDNNESENRRLKRKFGLGVTKTTTCTFGSV